MQKFSLLLLAMLSGTILFSQSVEGTWNGQLNIQGNALRIVVHLTPTDQGWTATMDSPDQGAEGIPVDKTSFENDSLKFEIAALQLKYSGQLSKDGGTIKGTFNQGGMELPLDFQRAPLEKTVISRPQDPTDFPYYQEEVTFNNKQAGIQLAGTLTLPQNQKPKAIAILVSGSGPQNRDEELFNHRPFLVLADYLTRNGIGVLRYDDRGVGNSGGDFKTATTLDFSGDAEAAFTYLSNRPDTKGARIGIIGHSEGGIIAPIVAARNANLDFIVLLAGPGMPSDELLHLQSKLISATSDAPAEIVELNQQVLKKCYEYLIAHPKQDLNTTKDAVKSILAEGLKQFPPEVLDEIEDFDAKVEQEAATITTPWFVQFIGLKPTQYLEQVKCPVLALNGALDLQVPPKENLSGIKKALDHNKQVKTVELEGLNHLFQKAQTGSPAEYGTIEETFNEVPMEIMASWINELK